MPYSEETTFKHVGDHFKGNYYRKGQEVKDKYDEWLRNN